MDALQAKKPCTTNAVSDGLLFENPGEPQTICTCLNSVCDVK